MLIYICIWWYYICLFSIDSLVFSHQICYSYNGKHQIRFRVNSLYRSIDLPMYHNHNKRHVWNGHSIPMWNIHIYNIERRNLETRKTLTTSLFRYETFYYLWVERFFDIRKEIHTLFYSGCFICTPHLVRHLPKASVSKRKSTVFSWGKTQLNSTNWLFQNPQNPPCASSAWRHSHSLVSFSISGYCDISEWHVHSVRAREHLY